MYKAILASIMLTIALGAHARGYTYHAPKTSSYGTGSSSYHEHVNGYTKSNGTYVAPHMRTHANSTQYDNFSTRGNYNPYTNKTGDKAPRY